MEIIGKKIKDRRFTNLIHKVLKAGYMKFSVSKNSTTGTPEGSIVSPILSNIYLNELDKFIDKLKSEFDTSPLPGPCHGCGTSPPRASEKPKINPTYNRLRYLNNKESNLKVQARIPKLLLKTPYYKAIDPSFKKITYVRYANH